MGFYRDTRIVPVRAMGELRMNSALNLWRIRRYYTKWRTGLQVQGVGYRVPVREGKIHVGTLCSKGRSKFMRIEVVTGEENPSS